MLKVSRRFRTDPNRVLGSVIFYFPQKLRARAAQLHYYHGDLSTALPKFDSWVHYPIAVSVSAREPEADTCILDNRNERGKAREGEGDIYIYIYIRIQSIISTYRRTKRNRKLADQET